VAESAAGPVDLVILGGGSGGYAAALRAAELGLSVVLVEKDKLGGTCLHRGCIPTKALLHSAEIVDNIHESATFGILSTLNGIDMAKVNEYKDSVVGGLFKGLTGLVKSRGIEVVAGTGKLTSPTTVTVDGRVIEGRNIILATGSYSRTLPGLDLDHEKIITSEDALTLDRVPNSVVVLGGGVIGCEFASVWRSYGADVTIIEALPHLAPLEDESSSKLLERGFRKRGIKFKLKTRFAGVKTTDHGVTVSLEDGSTVDAELLLVAVGRGPVTDGIGYDEVGVAMERGFVLVDRSLRTNIPNVFAIGDIRPGLQLAHVGFAEGIFVAEQIAGLNPTAVDYDNVPKVTYSSPEVASVGLTEVVAKERFGADAVTKVTYNLAGNGKSQILKTAGAVTVIAVKDGPVVGVHMVGDRVGELIAEAQLITNWEAYPSDVAQLIHPHPTMSEALGEAHLALAGKPLHTHD
jgi:dihydrolipoamide dehydrogenase